MRAAEAIPALRALNGDEPTTEGGHIWKARCPVCETAEALTVADNPSHRPFCDAGCQPSDVEAMLRQAAPAESGREGTDRTNQFPERINAPGGNGAWLESALDLLREPDPGPTPFAVEHGQVGRSGVAAPDRPET